MNAAINNKRGEAMAIALLAMGLLTPALFNRFPLIFPDSGTYLGIACGHEYAIDRSSVYGFFLKPFVTIAPGLTGLWLAVVAQALLLAALLWPVARLISGGARAAAVVLFVTLIVTSLGWHGAQFMPDAFTGATVLLGWLAVRRDPGAPGGPLLWLAAIFAALMHYTHVPLLLVAGGTSLIAQKVGGLGWRACLGRAGVLIVAVAMAILLQVGLNRTILDRPAMAPIGPLFIFARLNEDGLMRPWLADHCGRDAAPELCALAPQLPDNSQKLLWGGAASPITDLIWHPPVDAARWAWIDRMSAANLGAITARPGRFLDHSLRGTLRQFATFAALDDECPVGCHDRVGGIGFALSKYRPQTLAALDASRQVQDDNPKALLRAVTTPVAWLGLMLLPVLLVVGWWRRDGEAVTLVAAIMAALVTNAALAGALSDVHARYQSRIVWLAPFAVLCLIARWRQPVRAAARSVD